MNLTPMDYVRAALANAIAEGLDLGDVWAAAEHARDPRDFDTAVNTLVNATPPQRGAVWTTERGWEPVP